METSLTELESDISKLANQQERMQRQTFFLHGEPPQSESAKRRTWTVPSEVAPPKGIPPSARSQWGTPKAFAESSSSDESTPRGYNGDTRKSAPNSASSRNGSNSSMSFTPSFRLHSNADSQGNRLFNKAR